MPDTKDKLGIIFFPAFDWAISPTHPEREERLLYTQDQFLEEGVFDLQGITEYKPLIATKEDILRCHFCFPDVDSVCTEAHRISAGGAIKAAQLVAQGQAQKGFALVRPPGHHAMKSVHGSRGFCNINIEAVMIEWLRKHHGVRRIAVVDTDCHHGDGSQDVFWHDPDTLFISIHQDGRTLYPGSGFPDEDGGPKAKGRTINIPLPPNTGDEGFLQALQEIVMPILADFKPELIINSAGQDNHYSDPITNMNFSAQGYARLNDILNPDIAVLEGGYSIQGALPYVNLGIVLAMAGLDYSQIQEPDFTPQKSAQSRQVSDYIKELCQKLPEIYFSPSPVKEKPVEGFFIRQRSIFYDTDGIQENQREKLRDCPNCPGLLWLESSSNVQGLSLGLQIPRRACEKCVNLALEMEATAKKSKRYTTIQLIDQRQ